MKLNADQRAEFDREGYLFFPACLPLKKPIY